MIVSCDIFLDVFLDVFLGDFLTDPFAVLLINPFAVFLPISLMLILAVRFAVSRSVIMTVASLILNRVSGGNNVAELVDEFGPELDERFDTDFVVRTAAGDAAH